MKGTLMLTIAAALVKDSVGFIFNFGCLWNTCSQHCTEFGTSYVCSCDPGYVLNATDETSCDLYGPCPTGHSCQQICFNLGGTNGQRCSCRDGYYVNENRPTRCNAIRPCSTIVDIVFAFPNSATAGTNNFKALLAYLVKLVSHNPVANTRARYAAYGYGKDIMPIFALKDLKTSADVSAKLLKTPYQRGKSPVDNVLSYLVAKHVFSTPNGGRSYAPNILVVFLDSPIADHDRVRTIVQALKNSASVRIIAVGIGSNIRKNAAQYLSTSTAEGFWVSDYPALNRIEQRVASNLC